MSPTIDVQADASADQPPPPRLIWQAGIYRIVQTWTRNQWVNDDGDPPFLDQIVVEQARQSALGEPRWDKTQDDDLPNDALRELLIHVGLLGPESSLT